MTRFSNALAAPLLASSLMLGACSNGAAEASQPDVRSGEVTPVASSASPALSSAAAPTAVAAPSGSISVAPADPPPLSCRDGMVLVPSGIFWMGAPYAHSKTASEWKHKVAVRPFCLDLAEVTARTYQACVDSKACTPARQGFSCTTGRQEKLDHPINCVDWFQADAACKAWGKRLPSEQEWEYAARGGAEQRTYSWGEDEPDGHACYNHPGTCTVKAYPAGAFGLHDMMGNVWEWTASQYIANEGWSLPDDWRVYRGGSFSRRFPKWMKGWVRNRYRVKEYGGHLGFRCAADLVGSTCPEGSHDSGDGTCAVDGEIASTAPPSPAPRRGQPAEPAAEPSRTAEARLPKPAAAARDARFDEDCSRYKPGKPICYHVQGGGFADRERIRRQMGCANRDVGLDFNSVCCPDASKTAAPDAGAK